MERALRVGVVGRGRVGSGLGRWLDEAGAHVVYVSGRKLGSKTRGKLEGCDLIVLAVPDASIQEVALRLVHATAPLLHCAGRVDERAFGTMVELDARPPLGALHPLISFASKERPPRWQPGYAFALAGEEAAQRAGRRVIGVLQGVELKDAQSPAYHAAAALVANGAAALALIGVDVLARVAPQLSPKKAAAAMGALLRSVADNVQHIGVPDALTGPVRRGDAAAVEAHRKALNAEERSAYDAAARLILDAAERAGLPAKAARRMREFF